MSEAILARLKLIFPFFIRFQQLFYSSQSHSSLRNSIAGGHAISVTASGGAKVQISLPMISSLNELAEVKEDKVPNAALTLNLIKKLKATYQAKGIVKRLYDGFQSSVTTSFINLQFVDANEQNDSEKMTLDASYKQQRSQDIYQTKGSIIEPNELPIIVESDLTITRRVLILGRAGIGKTTVCQYYAARWAAEEMPLWQEEFAWVFWIPLRELTYPDKYVAQEKNYDLIDMIQKSCFTEVQLNEQELKFLRKIIAQTPGKILWIIDGYDEISPIEKRLAQCLQACVKDLLNQPHVIVTSRPHAISEIKANVILENMGFTQKNIIVYIDTFFKSFPKPVPRKGEDLKKFLKDHPSLQSLAHIPICLELICSIWDDKLYKQQKSGTAQIAFFTITHLYEEILQYYLRRYLTLCFRLEEIDNWPADRVSHEAKPALFFLERLAIDGLFQDSLFLPGGLVQQSLRSCGINVIEEGSRVVDQVTKRIGFLKPLTRKPVAVDNDYCFVHPSFQEFLAARYLARWFKEPKALKHTPILLMTKQRAYADIHLLIDENSMDPEYEDLWVFMAGSLRDDPLLLEAFIQRLLAGKNDKALFSKENRQRLLLSMRCLEACGVKVIPPALCQRLLALYKAYAKQVLFRYLGGIKEVYHVGGIKKSRYAEEGVKEFYYEGGKEEVLRGRFETEYRQLIIYLKICPTVTNDAGIYRLLDEMSEYRGEYKYKEKSELHPGVLFKEQAFLAKLELETDSKSMLEKLSTVAEDNHYSWEIRKLAINRLSGIETYEPTIRNLLYRLISLEQLYPAIIHVTGKFVKQDVELLYLLTDILVTPGQFKREAVDTLNKAMTSLTPETRVQVVKRINQITENQFNVLSQSQLIENRSDACELLSWLGKCRYSDYQKAIEETLFFAVFDDECLVREAALKGLNILGKYNDKAILQRYVTIYLYFSNTFIGPRVAVVLNCLLRFPLISLLLSSLKANHAHEEPILKLFSQFDYSGGIHEIPDLKQVLSRYLEADDPTIRKSAAISLGKLGEKVEGTLQQIVFETLEDNFLQDIAGKILAKSKELPLRIEEIRVKLNTDPELAFKNLWLLKNANLLPKELLHSVLNHKDPKVKKEVISHLQQYNKDSRGHIAFLLLALEQTDPSIRLAVAAGLVRAKKLSPDITPLLVKVLEDKDPNVRSAVAAGLASAEKLSPEVIPLLVKALEDQDPSIRRAAAAGLARAKKLPPDITLLLVKALEDQDSSVRSAVGAALARAEKLSSDVIPLLVKALENKDPTVRRAVVAALASAEKLLPEAIPLLLKALEDQDSGVRRAAAAGLARAEKLLPDAIPLLVKALEDQDPSVYSAVAAALARVEKLPSYVIPLLVKVLENKDSSIRRVVIASLASAEKLSPEAIPLLVKVLEDQDSSVRRAVAAALAKAEKLPPDVIRLLVKTLENKDPSVRSALAEGLARAEKLSPDIIPLLVKALEDQDPSVRFAVAEALARAEKLSPDAIPLLVKALKDKDPSVGSAVAAGLARAEKLPADTIPLLVKALEDKDPTMRSAVAAALARAEKLPSDAISLLVKALEDKDPGVRSAVAAALARAEKLLPDAIPLLVKALEDQDPLVHSAALICLEKFEKTDPKALLSFFGEFDIVYPEAQSISAMLLRIGGNPKITLKHWLEKKGMGFMSSPQLCVVHNSENFLGNNNYPVSFHPQIAIRQALAIIAAEEEVKQSDLASEFSMDEKENNFFAETVTHRISSGLENAAASSSTFGSSISFLSSSSNALFSAASSNGSCSNISTSIGNSLKPDDKTHLPSKRRIDSLKI